MSRITHHRIGDPTRFTAVDLIVSMIVAALIGAMLAMGGI